MADIDPHRFRFLRRAGPDRVRAAGRALWPARWCDRDLLDRRRFRLVTQIAMLLCSTALAALTIANPVSPWLLLTLLFGVGTGQALTSLSQAVWPWPGLA